MTSLGTASARPQNVGKLTASNYQNIIPAPPNTNYGIAAARGIIQYINLYPPIPTSGIIYPPQDRR